MDAVYNRHVLGPKTTLNLFFSFAKRKYPRNGWYVAKTFSVLNVESLFIVATKCPPNRYLLLCQSFFYSFLFDIMPAKWMHLLCERRCQLWFSVGFNALEMDVFCGVFNVTPMFGWIKMHPARTPFTTDGLKVSLFLQGNAPNMDAFCDSGSQCVIAKCTRHGRLLRHRLSM